LVIRLHYGSATFGIIGVSLPFDIINEEEISLFKEVTEDISFALHSIEEEKERKEFEKALEYKARFENMVLDISTKFINLTPDKIPREIERALGEIGTFADVDRCYLLQFSADGSGIEDEYVWYAEGIEQEVEIPEQDILKKLSWAAKKLSKTESIYVASVDKLPPEAKKEKRLLLSVGIKSLLLTPLVSSGSVIGCIGFDSLLKEKHWSDEIVYLLKITGQIFANALERKMYDEQLNESFQKMQRALEGTVQALSSIIEKKDPYTAGHQNRVAELAVAIGREMGLSEERLEDLRFAGLLHDIGKIHIPAEILNKPYSLNKVEKSLIKTHSRIGYEILKSIDFPGPVPEIVLQHHERIDGSGYPDGVSGKDILVEAQILGVSDVVESMSSKRPYRSAIGVKSVLKEIKDSSGILFAPDVVKACIKIFKEEKFTF
jgi:putative nucleotidyltransferase with HDIG domain